MNHIVKRIGILTGVFAAALCVFFLANNRWNSGQDQAVYMDMEAASLPSVTVQMLDRDMNRLYGYRQEMNTTAAGETLTILPEATRSFDSYRMVVYSLVLVLMMIFRPGGLLGSYDFSLSRVVEKALNGQLFRKHTEKEAADHE